VQARDRDEVDGQLAEVGVELAREAEAAGDAAHGVGDLGRGEDGEGEHHPVRYSSRILEMRSVPMPDPVSPPREWHTWKPAAHGIRNGVSRVIQTRSIQVHRRSLV